MMLPCHWTMINDNNIRLDVFLILARTISLNQNNHPKKLQQPNGNPE